MSDETGARVLGLFMAGLERAESAGVKAALKLRESAPGADVLAAREAARAAVNVYVESVTGITALRWLEMSTAYEGLVEGAHAVVRARADAWKPHEGWDGREGLPSITHLTVSIDALAALLEQSLPEVER